MEREKGRRSFSSVEAQSWLSYLILLQPTYIFEYRKYPQQTQISNKQIKYTSCYTSLLLLLMPLLHSTPRTYSSGHLLHFRSLVMFERESFHTANCLFNSECNHSQSAQFSTNSKQESNKGSEIEFTYRGGEHHSEHSPPHPLRQYIFICLLE